MSQLTLAQRLGLRVDVLCRHRGLVASHLQPWLQHRRSYSAGGTIDDFKDEIETINEKFVEARDEIEMAQEDAETVYFNESCDTARKAVHEVLDGYQQLCAKLSDDERGKLQRSMGLKMEQLKAELGQLDELHA